MSIFRLQTSSENGTSPFTSVIEETTQADAPPQLYKPGLKRLWKMEPNEQLEEANQKRPGPFYKAEITWKAPKDTGGLPITEYRLQQRIADRNQSWELKYGGKNESTVVDNLPPGSRIEFRVQVCDIPYVQKLLSDWSNQNFMVLISKKLYLRNQICSMPFL